MLVPGGLDGDEIKALKGQDLEDFVKKVARMGSVRSQQVADLAADMGCPAVMSTKTARLAWMIKEVQAEE